MAIHGYTWLYIAIHGYTWLYMGIHGYFDTVLDTL